MTRNISLDSISQVPQNYIKLIECKTSKDSIMSCPIENEFDNFDKQEVEHKPNDFIYQASDGKGYSLRKFLIDKIDFTEFAVTSYLQENFFQNVIDKVKSFFNIGHNTKELKQNIKNTIEILETSENISHMFEAVTGLEYTNENVEKLLKNEIKLDFEKYAEEVAEIELITTIANPIVENNYSYKYSIVDKKELNSQEKIQFNEILSSLDNSYQNKLQELLDKGKLINNNSENSDSILNYLYKILTTKRAEGIDNTILLKECIDLLENSYLVTQNGENIPKEYQNDFIKKYGELEKEMFGQNFSGIYSKDEIEAKTNYRYLGTCAAASLEYSLLVQNPNEFFKMIENLSSEKKEYKKQIKFKSEKDENIESMLTKFNVPYKFINENIYEITIKADEDAYFLSEIQVNNKDENERGICDILAQSAIMNLGSRQTYNSITDTRLANELTQDTRGLIGFEVKFADKILLNNKDKIYKEYMSVDNNLHITKRENLGIIKNDILKTLEVNKSVIMGQVYSDNNQICGGHEITIVGYEKNLNGDGFFIIQDSDDEVNKPVAISEQELLQQIHHAMVI